MLIHNKKILAALICLIQVIILCGCSAASKSQMLSYSNNNFGSAKCISYENSKEKSMAVMEDKQYGFKYTVSSSIEDFNLDGSTFFKYENKYSDFLDKYTKYITQTDAFSDILKQYDAEIEFDEAKYINVTIGDPQNASNTANAIAEAINDIDSRKYFSDNNYIIYLHDKNENSAGEYSFEDSKYRSPEEAEINWILGSASQSIYELNKYKGDAPEVSEFEYMYTEYMDASRIPGRDKAVYQSRITDTEESLAHTMVVHFMYSNKEWIVADCLGENTSSLYVYCLTSK